MIGAVEWDVTEDVKNGIDNWLIRRTQGGGFVRYYSKDNPVVTDPQDPDYNPNLAPRLVVEQSVLLLERSVSVGQSHVTPGPLPSTRSEDGSPTFLPLPSSQELSKR